jgi:hypothetical protein
MEGYLQGTKRKSTDNCSNESSSKKQIFPEDIIDENNEDSINEPNSEVEDDENIEYSEIEDCDDYSNDESDGLQRVDSNEDNADETRGTICDIVIPDDNYLSFSDNEITDERIVESRQNPNQESGANKGKRKVKRNKKKKDPNMRRNIRNVLKDKQLDSTTQKLREKELDRLKKLGMIPTTSVITPTSTAVKSDRLSKKPIPQNTVICLTSSDEEEEEDKKEQRGNNGSCLSPTTDTNKNEVFVLSSDSDEPEMDEEEKLAEHHSNLGLWSCFFYDKII